MPIRKLVVSTQVVKDASHEFEETASNLLMIADSVLTQETCDVIINVMDRMVISEVFQEDDGKICAKELSVMDKSWRYEHPRMGHDVTVLEQGTAPFEEVLDLVEPYLPKTAEFGEITYATIMKYPQDTMFQWHKDEADQNDTGTTIFMLNDNYQGGRLNVEGHILQPRTGTMVAFNNSTERWHGVEPLFQGERYVLAIWFKRHNEEGSDFDEKA